VPVEVPEGVNRGAVFGEKDERYVASYGRSSGLLMNAPMARAAQSVVVTRSESVAKSKAPRAGGGGGGIGSGSGGGVGPPPPKPANNILIDAADVDGKSSLSPEEQKRGQLQAKFHPTVLAVIDRLKAKNTTAGAEEAKFIHNGKAEVQIWLTDKSDATIAALKALGFEVVLDPKSARMVIGRLPIEKLAALADLKSVRYVAPQM